MIASGQLPDVRIKLDVWASYRTDKGDPPLLKLYNVTGHHSTLALIGYLEHGFRAYVSEKLEKFSGEVDSGPLEEYTIEDPGLWRLGKQFLPFGSEQIVRESVPAARADTNLLFEGYPVSVAACDAGPGYQRGIVARIGARDGFSVAVGEHFGIASTALTQIRRPEDSPGQGRGWGQIFGGHFTHRVRTWTIRGEAVAFRRGETNRDHDLTLADGSVSWQPSRYQSFNLGWTREFSRSFDVFRGGASFRLTKTTSLEPLLRYTNKRLYDAAIELHIRL